MEARIKFEIHKVVDDGNHNAFTDLAEFRGRYFLTYRSSPDGHMIYSSSEIVVRQCDELGNWEEVARFGAADFDVRDPHFVVHKDRLFVYSGAWPVISGQPTVQQHEEMQNFVIYSDDGIHWSNPQVIEATQGLYFWRGASFGGVAYIGAKAPPVSSRGEDTPDPRDFPLVFLASEDGLRWVRRSVVRNHYGDEMAFVFQPDGQLIGVARDRRPMESGARLVTSMPPYTEWDLKPLELNFGGPFVGKIDDRFFVAGRRMQKNKALETVLCWLDGDVVREFAVLPSGGDNGYPGYVQTAPGQGLLSYYSSHEGTPPAHGKPPSAIYVAHMTW